MVVIVQFYNDGSDIPDGPLVTFIPDGPEQMSGIFETVVGDKRYRECRAWLIKDNEATELGLTPQVNDVETA